MQSRSQPFASEISEILAILLSTNSKLNKLFDLLIDLKYIFSW